jgi:tetratricopeptide (TPR) repeat protein
MVKRLPLLLAVLALSLWLGNFIIRNFLAASLIAYGEDSASREQALAYAPSNPAVAAARAKYLLYRAEPPRPAEAIAELERAASLSPRDYRYWLELGRAHDSLGDAARAESALRRAVELAPRYFDAQWALANSLLRAGKSQPAIEAFQRAMALSGRDRPDEKAVFNSMRRVASRPPIRFRNRCSDAFGLRGRRSIRRWAFGGACARTTGRRTGSCRSNWLAG